MRNHPEIDSDIDVSAGAKNLAGLNQLKNVEPGLMIGPSSVGQTELYLLAIELTKARKKGRRERSG